MLKQVEPTALEMLFRPDTLGSVTTDIKPLYNRWGLYAKKKQDF